MQRPLQTGGGLSSQSRWGNFHGTILASILAMNTLDSSQFRNVDLGFAHPR